MTLNTPDEVKQYMCNLLPKIGFFVDYRGVGA